MGQLSQQPFFLSPVALLVWGKGPPCKMSKMPIFFLKFTLFYAWPKLSSDFFLAASAHLMTEYNFCPQIVKNIGKFDEF